MKTYKDLLDVLSSLSEEQLNTEIKFLPVGIPESEAPTLECGKIASSFDLVIADRDVIHCKFPSDSWQESGYTDNLSFEEIEEDKEERQVNTIAVRKGDPYFLCILDY